MTESIVGINARIEVILPCVLPFSNEFHQHTLDGLVESLNQSICLDSKTVQDMSIVSHTYLQECTCLRYVLNTYLKVI